MDQGKGIMSLQVILAGHNGDTEVLRSGEGEFTPETLSAAYARISRSPDPVPLLREQARAEVESSRKSNKTIVFGLGHHSVAEHAVFNFDILGLSRLAVESLEWHRLCSYTEKSQRYITLDGDWVLPSEFDETETQMVKDLVAAQVACYHELLPKLTAAQVAANPGLTKKQDRAKIEGWAKEDARYVVPLATELQLGFTANARNLELIIRRFRRSPLSEVRELGQKLFEQAKAVAPSLIILADEEGFEKAHGVTLQDRYFEHAAADLQAATSDVEMYLLPVTLNEVQLVNYTPEPDTSVVGALLFAAGRGPMNRCLYAASVLPKQDKQKIILKVFSHMSKFDAPPRAFEEAVFQFELVIDASVLAHVKRHRMTTQQWGPYDVNLGVTVPPMIDQINERERFMDIMDHTDDVWRKLRKSLAGRGAPVQAADYVLTNAHRRRITITANLRELYHFSRMREDEHAQWAIRRISKQMSEKVRIKAPAAALLLGGKHCFDETVRDATAMTYR